MISFIKNEFKNIMTLYYLIKLDKSIPENNLKNKQRQNRKIHRMMKRAYKIPFYRQRFDDNNLTPNDFHSAEDLAKFPILNRAELKLWMQNEIKKNPDKVKNWRIFSTSGSSGVPLKFAITQRENACYNANWIRVLMFSGYKPFTGKMLSFLTTHAHVDPKKGDSWIQKLGILRRKVVPEHLYAGEGMRDLIQLVNDYRPDMICFRKNVLVRMALYAKKHDLEVFKPKVYTPVSEMVDEATKRLLLETYGDGLMDAYGCNETGSCAVKIPGSDKFYVCNDTHVINLVNENGELVDDGRAIITTLYKRDFPIINYEVGDLMTSETVDGLRYIKTIKGRINDMVMHADGKQTSATELYKIPNGIVGISQFRYVQNAIDEIDVLLVKDPLDDENSIEKIEEFFNRKFDELYGYHEFDLNFKWMDVIPPDENGKMRCFVCNIN